MKKLGLRNLITLIVLGLSIPFLAFSISSANQAVFEVEATLSPPTPSPVSVGAPISAAVNFGTSFSSIEQICFIFDFQDDLLDPGEELFFGPFLGGSSGFGFTNVFPNPQSSRTICIIGGVHPEVSLFLDGQQDFGIEMITGSVIIGGLTVQITGVPATTSVNIDIKPGSDPNSINCNINDEVITVAILTTETFDATTVDHTTVTFEGAGEIHVDKKTGEPRRHEEDVDGDGDADLVFHFRLGDTGLTCESTEGTLTGQTFDGVAIQGTDAVHMLDEGGGRP